MVLSYPLSCSAGIGRGGPWEWGWFPERFTSGTHVSKFQFDQEWQAKNGYVIVLPLNHYYIYYLVWDTEEGVSCLLCFLYIDKIKLLRSALLKIAKCANEGKNTKPKCRSFLRFKNSLFLYEAKCNTFCYFFFTICKVYNVLSYGTLVDSWNCEIACISNKCPLLET